MESAPFVSVVTPIHNNREHLPECIESVLRQTYRNWEHVLVDNCSTDGSAEIAADYALRFPEKIRLVSTEALLTRVQSRNFALSCIAPNSKYSKVVLAEDWIYPECLARMVALAEWDCSIGLVSSYRLKGNRIAGDGLGYTTTVMAGADLCRQQLTTSLSTFGTPTTVLYRSEIIRDHSPFYEENRLREDTDACYRTLRTWNFGFVHQVLSFSRTSDSSAQGPVCDESHDRLEKVLEISTFGPIYLDRDAMAAASRSARSEYYNFLAQRLLYRGSRAFWHAQTTGLRSGGLRLNKVRLLSHALLQVLWMMSNPGLSCARLLVRDRAE